MTSSYPMIKIVQERRKSDSKRRVITQGKKRVRSGIKTQFPKQVKKKYDRVILSRTKMNKI